MPDMIKVRAETSIKEFYISASAIIVRNGRILLAEYRYMGEV